MVYTVRELQQRNIGVYADVHGISNELTVVAMQDLWFFSMNSVSKMLEWSIIRVHWANRRLGQYAGEWSSCEGFLPPIFCARGCKGPRQRRAATRGCGGTEHAFLHPWEKLLFFCLDRHCEVLHFDVKHCWLTVKSVSTTTNWLQCRRSWCWERIAANFLLLKHFWQYKQCFPSMKDFTLTVWSKKKIHYVLCYKFNVFIHFYCILWL